VDSIDRRLLDLLRENARTPYAELARKVGLSAPAVHERVSKLEGSGIIRGYTADIAPEAIGLPITAVIGIVQDSSGDTDGIMAGEESFLLKVRVTEIGELERLIVELNRIKGVSRTRTAIALSTKWEARHQAAPSPG
jgi:Lrp/AsnC family leucine-responsive transcriptional regulator